MPVPANMKQAIVFGAASALSSAISDTVADAVHNFLYGDPAAKAAADAEAAEAERERQAEIARQLAIQEQKRQEMFRRLGQELMGFSDGPQLQLMGMGNSPDLQLMGMDRPNDLQLMGFGNQAPALNAPAAQTPLGPQTCFFGECGPQDPGLQDQIEPWGHSNVVDLRDLQQGVDLASLATKAQPADRQAIMDQALAAANGDKSIRIAMPASTAVPVMSERGLLAFQQANDAYRYAHESALRMQESFNQIEAQRQGLYAVMKVSEDRWRPIFRRISTKCRWPRKKRQWPRYLMRRSIWIRRTGTTGWSTWPRDSSSMNTNFRRRCICGIQRWASRAIRRIPRDNSGKRRVIFTASL